MALAVRFHWRLEAKRVSPAAVFAQGQADFAVFGEVGVAEDEALDAREDALDRVEPGCIYGRVDEIDVVGSGPADDFVPVVRAPVVQDDVETFVEWIAPPQVSEEVAGPPASACGGSSASSA